MANPLDDMKLDANNKGIELAFPKYETEEDDEYISKGGTGEGLVKYLFTRMCREAAKTEL
jgi:hypothetical protein